MVRSVVSPKTYYIMLLVQRLVYSYKIDDKIDVLKSLVSFLMKSKSKSNDLMKIMDILSELEARLIVYRSIIDYYERESALGNLYDVPHELLEYCRIKSEIKMIEAKIIDRLSSEEIPISIIKPSELRI